MLRVTMARALSRVKMSPKLDCVRGQSTLDGAEPELDPGRVVVKVEELPKRQDSEKLAAFRKKMKEDMAAAELNRYTNTQSYEEDPLPPWPNNINPHTGEIGGPRGPEPTRYGDWERKGICVDF